MKKINNYRLQYWLYAILNKKFGSEVKLKRDVLHARYEVNRHGFSISTNALSLKVVAQYLQDYLKQCNYVEDNVCARYLKKDKVYISINMYDNSIYCMGRVY